MGVPRIAPMASAAALLLACLASTTAARAQEMDGAAGPPSSPTKAAAPLRLEKVLSASPILSLVSAEEGARDQLDALRAWNAAGKRPTKNGFARPLPEMIDVRLTPSLAVAGGSPMPMSGGYLAAAGPGRLVWGTHLKIAGAHRVRLHLTDVRLPAGTRMVVAAPGGRPDPFGLELLAPGGDLWTPSVLGESAMLEVEVPVAELAANPPSGFALREAMEIVDLAVAQPGGLTSLSRHATSSSFATSGLSESFSHVAGTPVPFIGTAKDTSCLLDAACETNADLANIGNYRHAMAQLIFTDQGSSFLCSGSLLNDKASDFRPYLLTANHCISTQASASSLDAFWDFDTASCGGNPPDESTEPQSHGATLLATASADTSSDFTLLRLNSVPGGRFFLGWNANAGAIQQGTPLYRLSHPAPSGFPLALSFAQYTADPAFVGCTGLQPPNFFYEHLSRGASFGGSSGSPVLLTSGQVVGQLGGGCGPNPSNACDYANEDFDGAFAVSFATLQPYLAPSGTTGPCVADANTLCIDNNSGDSRFQIKVAFHTTQGGGSSGNGHAIPLASLGVNQGGLFSFFSANNPEMLIKVLNACSLGNHFWVFFAAVTNVGFTVTVTDTVTGHQQAYTNADLHAASPVQDTGALICP